MTVHTARDWNRAVTRWELRYDANGRHSARYSQGVERLCAASPAVIMTATVRIDPHALLAAAALLLGMRATEVFLFDGHEGWHASGFRHRHGGERLAAKTVFLRDQQRLQTFSAGRSILWT